LYRPKLIGLKHYRGENIVTSGNNLVLNQNIVLRYGNHPVISVTFLFFVAGSPPVGPRRMQLDWRRLSTCLQLRYENCPPRFDETFNDKNTVYYRRISHCTVRLRHTAATRLSCSFVRPTPFDLVRPSDLDCAKQPNYIGAVSNFGLLPTRG
jgi:hypothetical protein